VNNLPKVATQWNSGSTQESNPGPRVRILSALTTKPLSHTSSLLVVNKLLNADRDSPMKQSIRPEYDLKIYVTDLYNAAEDSRIIMIFLSLTCTYYDL